VWDEAPEKRLLRHWCPNCSSWWWCKNAKEKKRLRSCSCVIFKVYIVLLFQGKMNIKNLLNQQFRSLTLLEKKSVEITFECPSYVLRMMNWNKKYVKVSEFKWGLQPSLTKTSLWTFHWDKRTANGSTCHV